MTNSSLRRQLLITIIVLMLFVSSTIIWVSIQAGTDAVNHMTQRVMLNMIERIGNDNENQLNEAIRAIETIAPNSSDLSQKQNFPTDMATLEQRLWFAGNLYQQTTDFVYFAGPDGRFIGLHRAGTGQIDLFLRNPEDSQRVQYTVQKPGDRGRPTGTSNYDARSRPWYIEAISHDKPVWSDIYSSYTDHQPAITLAKAIYQPDQRLAGVVATDILLKTLSDHLHLMHISDHSIAYIVDSKGYIVASSASDYPGYVLASKMADPLIRQSYLHAVKGQFDGSGTNLASTKTCLIDDEKVDVAYARLGNKFGLQWTSVVAVPRSDFMAGINRSVLQSIVIVVMFIILALLVGLKAIEHMLRDIRQLTSAALKLGNGEPLPRLHIHRKDEIGNLVKTFIEMENKLRFDRLTQVNNRDFLMAQIDFLQRHAAKNPAEKVNFTLLFLDLDKFKAINDGMATRPETSY